MMPLHQVVLVNINAGVEMYVTSCPSNAPISAAIRVTRDKQEIDVEALNVSNQCLNISFIGAILVFLSMA